MNSRLSCLANSLFTRTPQCRDAVTIQALERTTNQNELDEHCYEHVYGFPGRSRFGVCDNAETERLKADRLADVRFEQQSSFCAVESEDNRHSVRPAHPKSMRLRLNLGSFL